MLIGSQEMPRSLKSNVLAESAFDSKANFVSITTGGDSLP